MKYLWGARINISMRLIEFQSGPNWVRYTKKSLEDDFAEYKKKEETKWKSRAKVIGARWPIFDSIDAFQHALDIAKIVNPHLMNNVINMTINTSIEDIENMVSSYIKPRDTKRIISGFKTGATMPMGIILQGAAGYYKMAGNTRQAIARVLGVPCKALLVNVRP